MKIRDLGVLDGPIWLFGGALSNLQATQAFQAQTLRAGVGADRVICTGDLVGYGADPVAVLDLVRTACWPVIAGNVERQLAANAGDCGCGFKAGSMCDRLSAEWYGHADRAVKPGDRDWMEDLPDMIRFAHDGRRYAVVHGGQTDIARFLWPSSPDTEFRREITAVETVAGPVDGVIGGHCGVAFERRVDGVNWINTGAVGLPPHDGRTATRYAVLGGDGVRFFRLTYDWQGAQAALRTAGLVQGYESTLETGLWPSEDVLPVEMRR